MVLPASASSHDLITTTAGTGTAAYGGDGGPATAAQLATPASAAIDKWGNTLIADQDNTRIRAVAATAGTFYGIAMVAGDIYTVAGVGTCCTGGDGGPATAAHLYYPEDVKTDNSGNIVIADTFAGRVRVVAARSGTFYGVAMTAGDIYTVAGSTYGDSGDGGPATQAQLNRPGAVAIDAAGDLAIADWASNKVRVVAAQKHTLYGVKMRPGDIYTVAGTGTAGYAGDGGSAVSAQLNFPTGLAVDHHGNLVVVDSNNNAVRVVAGSSATFYGVRMHLGDIYTVAGTGGAGYAGDGGPATSAEFNVPSGVAVDHAGDLIVTDSSNNRVRAVAEALGDRYGVRMHPGDIYTVAGSSVGGFGGDGGRATSASLNFPEGVAVDGAGDIVIADTFNNRVRRVTS